MRIAKNKSKTIGEYTYEVTPLPAGQANEVLRRLLGMLGGGLEKLSGSDMEAAAVSAMGGMFRALNSDDQQFITRALASVTMVKQGQRAMPLANCFDEHFAGEMGEQLEWLWFGIEVNFSSFLGRLKSAANAPGLQGKIASVLKSQVTSTGSSIGSRSAENTTTPST